MNRWCQWTPNIQFSNIFRVNKNKNMKQNKTRAATATHSKCAWECFMDNIVKKPMNRLMHMRLLYTQAELDEIERKEREWKKKKQIKHKQFWTYYDLTIRWEFIYRKLEFILFLHLYHCINARHMHHYLHIEFNFFVVALFFCFLRK